jgi:hypothetical protein
MEVSMYDLVRYLTPETLKKMREDLRREEFDADDLAVILQIELDLAVVALRLDRPFSSEAAT